MNARNVTDEQGRVQNNNNNNRVDVTKYRTKTTETRGRNVPSYNIKTHGNESRRLNVEQYRNKMSYRREQI
jgi:hypothetical protein